MPTFDIFPNATGSNHRVTSKATDEYNCIAWAVHDALDFIWPDEREQYAWPPSLKREESVASFRAFFELVGFRVCAHGDAEPGFEKVAIYADKDGAPTHAARQLLSGRWTSKLGGGVDIEHATPHVLVNNQYGKVALYMRRRSDGTPPKLPELRPPRPALVDLYGSPLRRR